MLGQLTRHLEMLLQGRQGLTRKGFAISVIPLLCFGREELYSFLMSRDHMMHILAVKTRPLLLSERLCGLLMLFVCLPGYCAWRTILFIRLYNPEFTRSNIE